MRDFKNMKRQRGRNRGGGNGGGGGGKPQQNANRAFDSNGPDNVKIRGHAQHVFEKYQQLARDTFASGDRVLAENYLQHADHYFRVLRTIQPQRPPSEILGRDVFASGLDLDFEEEYEGGEEASEIQPALEATEASGDQPRFETRDSRDNRRDDRYDGNRAERPEPRREGNFEPREGRYDNRDGRQDNRRDPGENRSPERGEARQPDRDGRREDRYEARPDRGDGRREGRRFEGRRDERPAREARTEEPALDPLAVVAPQASEPMPVPATEPETSPMLRSEDGGLSEAPAFLQSLPAGEDGEVRRPRVRRRRPRTFEGGEEGNDPTAAPAPASEDA